MTDKPAVTTDAQVDAFGPTMTEPKGGFRGLALIYGPPKIGKSTLVSSLVDVTLDLEGGMDEIPGVMRYHIKTLSEFRKALEDAKTRGFTRVAIDTIDEVNSLIETEVCAELGIREMGMGNMGGEWSLVRKKVLATMTWAKNNFDLVVFVGHQKDAIIEDRSIGSRQPDLPGKLGRNVAAKVDTLGFCSIDNDVRTVNFKPYEGTDSGSRVKELSNLRVPFFEAAEENQRIFDAILTPEGDRDELQQKIYSKLINNFNPHLLPAEDVNAKKS